MYWHYPCGIGETCSTATWPLDINKQQYTRFPLVESKAKAKLLYQTPELNFDLKSNIKIDGNMKIELGTTLPIDLLLDYLRDYDKSVYDDINGEDAIEPEDVLQKILDIGQNVNWFIGFARFVVQIQAGALFIRITKLKIKNPIYYRKI